MLTLLVVLALLAAAGVSCYAVWRWDLKRSTKDDPTKPAETLAQLRARRMRE